MWLTRLALKNPVMILMLALMSIALGIVSLTHLSVDLFPKIDLPVIRIATFYTGAGPEDIEKTITQPLERAVSASPGVERVESTSKQGTSLVTIFFAYGTNLDNAQFDVGQRVARSASQFPSGVQQPNIFKFDISNIPVVNVAVSSAELDEKQLYDIAYNTIEPQLERVGGVASATVSGGKTRELQVLVDRDAMLARGMDALDVVHAVQQTNLLLPSGSLKSGTRNYNLFSNTQVLGASQLDDLVVKAGKPSLAGDAVAPVRLRDIAKVLDATADQTEIVRINGSRGVFLRVNKQPGANTVAVVDDLNALLPHLVGVPPNVHLAISFDQSHYIRAAVSSLEHEAVQGGVLAILVILIFLVSLRATGIVAVAIPLSIISTFVLLFFTGNTLNVFTLGGLALGVGRLVDDSIVELENIHRHLEKGQKRKKAVLDAAQEVAMPILVSTITTIVVFFPVLFLTGVAKSLFMPLALTIAFALIMSFFVSRTVTPLLCYYWMRPTEHGRTGIAAAIVRRMDWMDEQYARTLRGVLRHRALTIFSILGLFAASLFLFKFIGTEFFPASDESQFSALYKAPVGTRVELTEQLAERLEAGTDKALAGLTSGGHPYTTALTDSGLPTGLSGTFSQNAGTYAGTMQVNLVAPTARKFSDVEAMDAVRKKIGEMPGTQIYFTSGGIVNRILNFGSSAPIDIQILGYDLDVGTAYAKKVAAAMRAATDSKGRPVMTDVQISREENYPEIDVDVDREKAGVLGVSEQQIAQNVLASFVGNTQFAPVPFTDPQTGNEYFINVRLSDPNRSHVDDLDDVVLRAPTNQMVRLSTIAHRRRSSGPVTIDRKFLQRCVDVTANVAPTSDLGSASDAAAKVMSDLKRPEAFTFRVGGQTAAQKQAFGGLLFAAILALALVYGVLASQFKSLIDPLVIMFSVPLGITGVAIALFVTGTTLSVNSAMGIIMMVGIVVSNGVLLVDFANVLRRRDKMDLVEATILAGKTRLRPILMTSIATIVGLAPMAIGLGEGAEANLPLARAVIGGLAVSTFFTLFLVPSLYTLLDRFAKHDSELDEDEDAPAGGVLEPEHA